MAYGEEHAYERRGKSAFGKFCLETGELLVADILYGHALHLNEPACSADRSLNNDERLVGETLFVETSDGEIVGGVTQVDNHHGHIVVGAFRLCQQRLDILPEAMCLLLHVLGIDDLPFIVDAGCT